MFYIERVNLSFIQPYPTQTGEALLSFGHSECNMTVIVEKLRISQ